MEVYSEVCSLIFLIANILNVLSRTNGIQFKHFFNKDNPQHFYCYRYFKALLHEPNLVGHSTIIRARPFDEYLHHLSSLLQHSNSLSSFTIIDNLSNLPQSSTREHVVWFTDTLDQEVIMKLSDNRVAVIHAVFYQPINVTQQFQSIPERVLRKLYVLHQVNKQCDRMKCQVITTIKTRKYQRTEMDSFTRRLHNYGIDVVTAFSNKPRTTLNVLATDLKPYIFYDKTRSIQGGIDYSMLQQITRTLNVDVNYTLIDKKHRVGGNDLKEFDLVIGGIDRHPINETAFESLMSYHQDDYTWCISRAKTMPTWQRIFHTIDDNTVGLIAGFYIFIIIILAFLLTAYDIKPLDFWKVIIHMERTLLMVPIEYIPKNQKVRMLYTFFTIICLWVNTIVLAFVIKNFSLSMYEVQVRSIAEIIEHNYKFLAPRELLDEILLHKMIPPAALTLLEECLNIDICLGQTISSHRHAVAVSRQYARLVVSDNQLVCFDHPDNIYSYTPSFWIRKDLYLTESLNDLITPIIEGGLVSKWVEDYKRIWPKVDGSYSVVLTLNNLTGAFLIVGSILLASIVVALLEQIIYRKAMSPTAHSFWIIASKFIDDERYLFPRKL